MPSGDNATKPLDLLLTIKVTEWVALCTAVSAIGGIVCDKSYFDMLYPPAFSLLSIHDHIVSALTTLPVVLFGGVVYFVLFGLIWDFYVRLFKVDFEKIQNYLQYDVFSGPQKDPRRYVVPIIDVLSFFVWVGVSLLVIRLFFRQLEQHSARMALLLFFWCCSSLWLHVRYLPVALFGVFFRIIVVGSISIGLCSAAGVIWAKQARSDASGSSIIHVTGGTTLKNCRVLRMLDAGVLFFEGDASVHFAPWRAIDWIDTIAAQNRP